MVGPKAFKSIVDCQDRILDTIKQLDKECVCRRNVSQRNQNKQAVRRRIGGEMVAHCGHRIDHVVARPGLVPFARPHARRKARTRDCRENTVSARVELHKNTINPRQDASLSYEKERQPMGVAAASHMTQGPLATGRTAALAGRGNGSLPFPKSTPQTKRGKRP